MLLASYALQAEVGDYNQTVHGSDYFVPEHYLPQRVSFNLNQMATFLLRHRHRRCSDTRSQMLGKMHCVFLMFLVRFVLKIFYHSAILNWYRHMWDWLLTPCEYRYRTLVANTLCNVVRTVNKAFRCCHCWCCCYCCCFRYLVCQSRLFYLWGDNPFSSTCFTEQEKKDVSWTNRHNRNEAKLNFLHLQLNNTLFSSFI